MAAESAVLISIAASLASGYLKGVSDKAVNALLESPVVVGVRFAIFGDLKAQVLRLERELSKLQALLQLAESLNPLQCRHNDLVLIWLRSVKEAAYFADDLLDDISYDKIRRQVENKRNCFGWVGPFEVCSSSDASFAFRVRIARKIRKFMSITAVIYCEAAEIGLRPVDLVANPRSYKPLPTISSDLRERRENVDTSFVIGRQDDEDLILHELCCANDDRMLPVIAITGISGVGKTTLARKVYDNAAVKKHFHQKTWIFVSDNFNLRRVLDEMLQSLTGYSHNLSNMSAMEEKLQGLLEQKRLLLVLDDVWNTDCQVWESVRTSLVRMTCSGGSRVLVTAQSSDVALVMEASLTRNLKVLHDTDAWALFGKEAFANKTVEQKLDLKDIGSGILKKCGGLPLAVKLLGRLLGSMSERSQWESVEASDLWSLQIGQTNIMPWLLLSFNHLPNTLVKQCFVHCSVAIPKGFLVGESFLIEVWTSQGFIQPTETTDTNVDAIGQACIKTLLANGLLQQKTHNGKDVLAMHDLIHDLALYLSNDATLIVKDTNDLLQASGTEYIWIHDDSSLKTQFDFSTCNKLTKLRTLSCRGAIISIDFASQARFLRNLALVYCGLNEVPSSIGGLKHLRRLNLSGNPFECLPGSVGALYNLQTLYVEACHKLMELPPQITKLVNLRHIYATTALHMPKGIGQLTCLMTAPSLIMKANEGWKVKELQSMPLLRGLVTIGGLEHINCREDAATASLSKKAAITHLRLIWTSEQRNEANTIRDDKQVMDGLQPHTNLTHLLVKSFCGNKFSGWLSEKLHSLVCIHLIGCNRCEQLPALGQFASPEEIVINGVGSVEVIGSDFSCTNSIYNDGKSKRVLFPKLKRLQLWNMPKLKDWADPFGLCDAAFPFLEELDVKNCSSLVSAPTCFPSLKQLKMNGINNGQALLMVLSNSSCLTSLTIEGIRRLTSLSQVLLKCTCLQEVKISDCKHLTELTTTFQGLGSLETLEVKNCDSLTSIPNINGLTSLRVLTIWDCIELRNTPLGLENCVTIENLALGECPELNLIPDFSRMSRLQYLAASGFSKQMSVPGWMSRLSSLHTLNIGCFNEELNEFYGIDHLPNCVTDLCLYGWPKLKSAPTQVRLLTQLVHFTLHGFEGVEELPEWVCELSCLETLEIVDCGNLKQLPTLEGLTQLWKLEIHDCPVLEERCRKDGGEDRHKISHLPSILINSVETQKAGPAV